MKTTAKSTTKKSVMSPAFLANQSKERLAQIALMPMKKLPKYFYDTVAEKKHLIESGEVNNCHVYIAKPNAKGAPHSVSTIPVHNCVNCSGCALHCYDLRHDVMHSSVRKTRAINSAILEADRERYFREINGACKCLDKFRWHVGGEVIDLDYFENMIAIANDNKHCKFHVFTKNYQVVNQWVAAHGGDKSALPENMHLRFSIWCAMKCENPYDFGTVEVVMPDTFREVDSNSAICGGNCTHCCIRCEGCFNRDIKTILIHLH